MRSGQNTWKVVGIFEADGGVTETEIWCDARVLQGAYRRGNTYQSVLARLDSSRHLRHVPRLAHRQPAAERAGAARDRVLRRSSRAALSSLIRTVGFGIAALMGIGAVFGAILTMYTAVSTRSREIATLRALGFNATLGGGVGDGRVAGPGARSAA